MLCENCKQNPATLHFTKIVNGKKNEFHLCEHCAKEKGEVIGDNNNGFSFHHLLSGLLNFDQVMGNSPVQTSSETTKCQTCGLTFLQFKKTGKFGCSDCYTFFENQLDPIFRRIHGNSIHVGKVPARSGAKLHLKKKITNLKEELQHKIIKEEFEEAAKLRDQIRALELKLSEGRG